MFIDNTVKLVLLSRLSSFSKLSLAISMALCTGMKVNSDTTSNETITLNQSHHSLVLLNNKITRILHKRIVPPINGERIYTKCFDKWYVYELTKDTNGLYGNSSL